MPIGNTDPDRIARAEAQATRWADTGLFSISEREQILSELKTLAESAENPGDTLKDQKERLAKYRAEAETYPESACAGRPTTPRYVRWLPHPRTRRPVPGS